MTTTTFRTTAEVHDDYVDVTVPISGMANATGILRNYGDQWLEIVKGGATKPARNIRGTPVAGFGREDVKADHVWVKTRAGGGVAVVGFEALDGSIGTDPPPASNNAFSSAAQSGLIPVLMEDM